MKTLITGASGGIGRAIAERFSAFSEIINLDIAEPKTVMEKEEYIPFDLTDIEEIPVLLRNHIIPKEPSIFIHCAGYGGPFHDLTDVTLDEWEKIFSVNLTSCFMLLKGLLPLWSEKKFGRFIAVASSLSIVGAANSAAYSASKHGLTGLVKSAAAEWGAKGITCNSVSPGYVETAMGVQDTINPGHRERILKMTPSSKIASPDEIARIVEFIASKESSYINGANWTADGGITSVRDFS